MGFPGGLLKSNPFILSKTKGFTRMKLNFISEHMHTHTAIPSVLGTALQKTKLELKPFKYCNESYGINSHGDDKMAIGMFCAEVRAFV